MRARARVCCTRKVRTFWGNGDISAGPHNFKVEARFYVRVSGLVGMVMPMPIKVFRKIEV